MEALPDRNLTLGQLLKLHRHTLQLTQEELAGRVGYTAATLQKIEQDRRRPSRALAALLADALMLTPDARRRWLELALAPDDAQEAAAPDGDLDAEHAGWRRPQVPPPPVALVGRERERAALGAQLRHGARLVTLVGPGGVGKTSLALQVAADLGAEAGSIFPDGIALAQLATATAESAPLAIAKDLGLELRGQAAAEEQLRATLRERRLLLVLDGCEQLVVPESGQPLPALVARMLDAAPHLAVLATSRERLRLRDERVFRLEGLGLPAAEGGPRADQAPAVRLFLERARLVSPTLSQSGAELAAIVKLCRRVEGLPLAIELAAAWTYALSPQEIAAELEQALDFLASDAHDTPARHRSLRSVLDHSWRLLRPGERRALACLAVVRGGCDRAAASAVTGAPLSTLAALVDKSLVRAIAQDGATRYTLHELVRQYAGERLAEDAAEARGAELRHRAYYAALLQRSVGAQTGEATPAVWSRLSAERENLRAAWLRAVLDGDEPTALGMAQGLMTLYDYQGRLHEGLLLFSQAAALPRGSGAAAGLIRGVEGYFRFRVGQLPAALGLLQEGVALAEAAGRSDLGARLRGYLGNAQLASGMFAEALREFSLAAEAAARVGDQGVLSWSRFFQGSIAAWQGDLATAERHFADGVAVWREQGYGRGLASALLGQAEIARLRNDPASAELLAREALQVASLAHDAPAVARCLRELGAIALMKGELSEARYLLTESCESLRSLNDWWAYNAALRFLVHLKIRAGEVSEAWRGCATLLASVRQGDLLHIVEAAYAIALLLAAGGDDERALIALAAAVAVPGRADTVAAIDALRRALESRVAPASRAAALAAAAAQPVERLLDDLCRRGMASAGAPAAPRSEAPLIAAAGLVIAETGETLSPRELEVLALIVAGASNQGIADTLVISPHTTKHHVASILRKLGVATRTQAALRGRALGILPPSRR